MSTNAASTEKKHRKQTGIRRMIIKLSRKLSIVITWRPRARVSRLLAMMLGAAVAAPVMALPTGEQVVSGSVDVARPDAGNMTVTQSTDKGIINWNGYGIGAGESVTYLQPSSTSVTLNRVIGTEASEIFGQLSANGQIFLVNPNGVLFAPGAQVNVGGLVATSLDISNEAFNAGTYTFSNGGAAGSVTNQGRIDATNYVVFAAPQVDNSGSITATGGTVALAAGDRVTLGLNGDTLLGVSVDAAAVGAAIRHSGMISADGGAVVMSARSADALMDTVLNVSGVVRAQSLSEQNGVIRLDGGSTGVVSVSGTLDASGTAAGETGGTITVLGDKVGLFDGARIDVSGDAGGGTVLVGGNYQGQGPEQNASMTYVAAGASINASATGNGDGGTVVVWSDETTRVYGDISVRGGVEGGDGGMVETSSHAFLDVTSAPDLSAALGRGGLWLIDPADLEINNTGPDNDVAGASPFAPLGAGGSVLTWATINTALTGGDVTVTTVGTTDVVGETGAISITEAGTLTGTNDLTINAADTLTVSPSATITLNGVGSSLIMSAANGITINANITTANTTVDGTSSGGVQLSTTSGDITINATVRTGSALVEDTNAGDESALTGSIQVTAGGTGVINGTGSLVTGNAQIQNAVGGANPAGTDVVAAGDITLSANEISRDGATAFSVTLGQASETNGGTATTLTQGKLHATADGAGAAGEIRITSSSDLRVGTLDTLNADATTVDLTVTGGNTLTLTAAANLDLDTVRLSADAIDFTAGANTFEGTGQLTLAPSQAGINIGLNAGAGTLDISTTDYAAIKTGFSSLTLGAADAGAITVGGATSLKADTTLLTASSIAYGANTISGSGLNLTLTSGTGITGTGGITTGGGDITLSVTGTGAVSVGALNSSSSAAAANTVGADGGAVSITTANGNITTGTISTSGGDAGANTIGFPWGSYNGGNAGDITIQVTGATAARAISIGAVTAVGGAGSSVSGVDDIGGNGGNGGAVSITAGGAFGASLSASSIDTSGGQGGTGDNAGGTFGFVIGGTGGAAGSVTVATTQGISVSGAITAEGGDGGGVTTDVYGGDNEGSGGNGGDVSLTSSAGAVAVQNISTVGGLAAISAATNPGTDGAAGSIALSAGTNLTPSGALNAGTSTIGLSFGQADSGGTLDLTGVGLLTGTTTATGGAGTDTLSGQNVTSTWALGASNTYTSTTNTLTFSGVENLSGGSGTDTLTGPNATTAWSITGANAVTVSGMNGTSMEALVGGTGDDTFTLATGITTFNGSINGGTGTDTLAATDGTNAWSITAANTGTLNTSTTFSNIDALTGGSGNDTFTLATLVTTFGGSISGGSGGTDTLAATDGTNAWAITGANAGTLNTSTTFSNIDALTGGTGNDTFTLATLVTTFGGSISGGSGGTDTLAATDGTNAWVITGANAGALNTSTTFSNIDALIGGSGTDTLTGLNATTAWSITGAKAVTVSGMNGTSMDALVGGTGADTFTLATGITTFNGSIDGGTGTDTLAATDGTNAWSITAANTGTLNTSTTFSNIDALTGGSGTDTLTGPNATTAWSITGANAVTVSGMNGTSMDALVGGTGADTFTLATGITTFNGSIDGGTGTDTLAATDGTNAWSITAANTGTLNTSTTFSNIDALTGGSGNDTYTLATLVTTFGGSISGGSGGTDTLVATDGTNAWAITGENAGTLNTSTTFSNIDALTGGSGTDTLTGPNATTAWSITGANAVTVSGMNGTSMEALVGGTGEDTFTLATGITTFNGSINGGAGTDTLAATNGTNAWSITADNAGTLNTSTAFAAVESLTGGSGADSYTGSAGALSGNITDAAGATTLAGTLTTGGSQAYSGAVTLAADTTADADGDITVASIDGGYMIHLRSNAGDVNLGGTVGGTVSPTSLIVETTGDLALPTTNVGALDVTATGDITESGNLTVTDVASFTGSSVTLNTHDNTFGGVTFNSTNGNVNIATVGGMSIRGDNVVNGDLTLTSDGNIDAWGTAASLTVEGDLNVHSTGGYAWFDSFAGDKHDYKGEVNIHALSSVYVWDKNDIDLGTLQSDTSIVWVGANGMISGGDTATGATVASGELDPFNLYADIRVSPGQTVYLNSYGNGMPGGIGAEASTGKDAQGNDIYTAESVQKAIHVGLINPADYGASAPFNIRLNVAAESSNFVSFDTQAILGYMINPAPSTNSGPIQGGVTTKDEFGNLIFNPSLPATGVNGCAIGPSLNCLNLFTLQPLAQQFDVAGILNAALQDLFNSQFGTDNIRVAIQNGFKTDFGVVPPGIDAIEGDGVNMGQSTIADDLTQDGSWWLDDEDGRNKRKRRK